MPAIIRPARVEDIAAMSSLLGELFAIEKDFQVDANRQRLGLALLMDCPGAYLLVAEVSKRVVGMVSVQSLISTAQGGTVGLLEDLVVDAKYRGQGIGSALVESALHWADSQGMSRVQLLADKNNLAALKFYAARQWRQTQLICLRKQ